MMVPRRVAAYWEDDSAYHTVIFGRTSLTKSHPEFPNVQMAAVRAVIDRRYPMLGSPAGDS